MMETLHQDHHNILSAAASTRCSCCGCCVGRTGCGFCGCTSYVQGPGLNNFCATGGSWGHHKCGSWCYTCKMQTQCNWCRSEVQGCVCGNWDFALGGINGSDSANQYCNTEHYPQTGAVQVLGVHHSLEVVRNVVLVTLLVVATVTHYSQAVVDLLQVLKDLTVGEVSVQVD